MFQYRETGQGLLEYGLAIVLVAVIIIIALAAFGEQIVEFYQQVLDAWPD
jgi:Flp pilus assembly pilin Flp